MREIIERYGPILLKHEILVWENEPTAYRFKAMLYFLDGSTLAVRDYYLGGERKYSYHWQDKDANILVRWDNAGHWKDVPTFPHHKHVKDEVLPSTETTIEDILDYRASCKSPPGRHSGKAPRLKPAGTSFEPESRL